MVWTGGAGTGVGEAGGEAGGEGEAEVAGEGELGTGRWADVPTEPHEATASAGAATATSTNSHHGRRMTTSARRPGSLGDHRLRPPAPILTMAHFSRELQGRKSRLGGRWAPVSEVQLRPPARRYSHAPSGANTMMIAAYQASDSQM